MKVSISEIPWFSITLSCNCIKSWLFFSLLQIYQQQLQQQQQQQHEFEEKASLDLDDDDDDDDDDCDDRKDAGKNINPERLKAFNVSVDFLSFFFK